MERGKTIRPVDGANEVDINNELSLVHYIHTVVVVLFKEKSERIPLDLLSSSSSVNV